MIQAVMIDGFEVSYSLETENICKVLGFSYIYTQVTYENALRIIYLGLHNPHGYSSEDFVAAVLKGRIYASKRRNHYPLSVAKLRVIARIRQINKEFVTKSSYKGLPPL